MMMMMVKKSGAMTDHDEKEEAEISRSVLSAFRAKEDEIQKMKLALRDRLQAQLGRVEKETKLLTDIRQELETLQDPLSKEVAFVRKMIDTVNRELKSLGLTCQKKEKEYKEVLESFNEKNQEKGQLVAKLMEVTKLSNIYKYIKREEG